MIICLVIIALSLLNQHCALSESQQSKGTAVELQTRLGMIRGWETHFLDRNIRSFLGVPFAEPPIGDNRFRAPKPKHAWKGTLDASQPSPACTQARDSYNSTFWGSEMWNPNTPVQEDCLYLNIWAPADAFNLTTMVWLFGGGYNTGSPSLLLYDGKAMASIGNIIVININYRLGPFGYLYLDHEDAPGNMGMLDQQLALQWIQENIISFGGNPSRITLFGESAGASSIVAHLIAPKSRGLFDRGILQSGSLDNKWAMDSPARALQKSRALAAHHKCDSDRVDETIRCMKAIPAQQLIDGIWEILEFLEFPFVIVSQDRNFFQDRDAFKALREHDYSDDVDLMIGINHDEGNYWNIYNLPQYFDKPHQPLLSHSQFLDCINIAFKTLPKLAKQAASFIYMDDMCRSGSMLGIFFAEQINQIVGDYFFTCDSVWLADQARNSPNKVYVYYFDQPSSANPWPKWSGVMHGYEIEFVLGVPVHNQSAGYTNQEKVLSRRMVDFWTSFANYGDPSHNSHDGSHWPPYELGEQWMYLRAGVPLRPVERRKKTECELWRSVKDLEYANYLRENSAMRISIFVWPSSLVIILPVILLIIEFR